MTRIEIGEETGFRLLSWVNMWLVPGNNPASFRKWELDLSNENGWSVSRSGEMVETVQWHQTVAVEYLTYIQSWMDCGESLKVCFVRE